MSGGQMSITIYRSILNGFNCMLSELIEDNWFDLSGVNKWFDLYNECNLFASNFVFFFEKVVNLKRKFWWIYILCIRVLMSLKISLFLKEYWYLKKIWRSFDFTIFLTIYIGTHNIAKKTKTLLCRLHPLLYRSSN